ncbi:hypothetical protein DIV09_03715, partial [Escherichia coli]
PGPVFHTIVSIKNDGHYFCRAGGNRPDGLNEPVTIRAGIRTSSGDADMPYQLMQPARNAVICHREESK